MHRAMACICNLGNGAIREIHAKTIFHDLAIVPIRTALTDNHMKRRLQALHLRWNIIFRKHLQIVQSGTHCCCFPKLLRLITKPTIASGSLLSRTCTFLEEVFFTDISIQNLSVFKWKSPNPLFFQCQSKTVCPVIARGIFLGSMWLGGKSFNDSLATYKEHINSKP